MCKNIYLWTLLVCISISCSTNHSSQEPKEDNNHAEKMHAGEIDFSPEMAKAVGLKTNKVLRGDFTDVVRTSGRIMAAQGEEMAVVATMPGIVKFGKVSFIDGTQVRRGEFLVSITSGGISEGDIASKIKNAYLTAKQEYERMKSLVDDKIVSAKDFEQARLTYENAKTAWEAIEGKQTQGGVLVTAPINGYLKNIQVKDGDYVSVGQPLAVISQNNRLVLRADVSEKYYEVLPMIQSANFRTPYDDKLYELSRLNGRILSYGKSSDSNSFYVPVSFEFDNKGSIIPGSFVEIYLLTSPLANVVSVPVSALIEEQGLYSVFILEHDDKYKKVPVTIGLNNGSTVQILSGLEGGEEVVTEGAYQIKLASASSAIPQHSHSH